MFAAVGRHTIAALRGLSGFGFFAVDTVAEIADHARRRRAPLQARLLFEQTQRVGVGSVPLVVLVSLFLGLTTSILAGYQLERLGAEQWVPAFVAVSFTRELGALLTGIVVAARSGAAFTAELGTMTVSEEVDAIEGMGVGALRYLVAPRVLASMLMLPSLSVVSNLAGLAGGAFVTFVQLDMSFRHFGVMAMDSLLARDIVSGLVKSLLFGLVIGWIACYKGLAAAKGATGVGIATTGSVVMSVTSVIGCDTLCNIVLVRIWP
jgi:phospholipid/cholesterol/gamma-HCH transport system permease protein